MGEEVEVEMEVAVDETWYVHVYAENLEYARAAPVKVWSQDRVRAPNPCVSYSVQSSPSPTRSTPQTIRRAAYYCPIVD